MFDKLREKDSRYVSHKLLLLRCISGKVVPNGFRLELELTTGNHSETFLNNWYDKLQQYLLGFIKGIILFCDKTTTDLKAEIKNIKNPKTMLKNNTFQEEQNIIKTEISP